MRKLLLMSTCLLTWTAMPLHAQTQPDAGTAPSQELRPPGQASSPEPVRPKAGAGETGGTRGHGPEQGQAEQGLPGRAEAPRNETLRATPKSRDAAQPDANATTGEHSPEAPKPKAAGAPATERQQTGESPRKRSPEEGEAARAAPATAKTQGEAETTRTQPKGAETGQRDQTLRNADTPAKSDARAVAEPNSAQGGARVEGKLRLDERQASAFHSRIVDRYRGESTHVDVDLSIGVAIPATVGLRPVPTEIVSEYPEFRDYDFFVEEDEVVIVEPRSREVVEIVGGGGRRHAGDEGGAPRLGRERIAEITRVITSDRSVLAEGGRGPMLRAPANAVIRPLPDRVASTMPEAAGYGYFVDREGRVVVVDRSSREVVDLVE